MKSPGGATEIPSSKEVEQFSLLVGSIYDAAFDATLWPSALEGVCGFVGGCRANLLYQGAALQDVIAVYSWGDNPEYDRLYIERYAALNPLFPAALFLEVGKVHAISDIMPIDEFRESRMCREWVQPQGLLDSLYTNLERTAMGGIAMSINRLESDGLFDDAARTRFALLVPHLRRAAAIGRLLHFHKEKESALSSTLDRLSTAVLLVAAEGRLVYVNSRADAMLLSGEFLRATNGRVVAVEQSAERQLRAAIAAAAQGDADLDVKGIAILLAESGDTSQVARVLPLTSGERRGMLDRQAAVAIFIHQTKLSVPAPLEAMSKLYNLTAGEVRVLAAVAETSGVENMAASLGISAATVKTHLQSLFAKTGVRRQSELIKMLAAHAASLQP